MSLRVQPIGYYLLYVSVTGVISVICKTQAGWPAMLPVW